MHIQDEDGVQEDHAEGGPQDEKLAAVGVRPRPGEEGVDHSRDGLQDAVVPLQHCKLTTIILFLH